ncbi:MAG: DEDD exonuclease domain-containing protein [Demequinaceae bacterium]|nr:DEDD exonuclease domain-containing protein [Demequinaceae bacterium]
MTTTIADVGLAIQPSLEDVGEPLSAVTFVTVDLETTGGSPRTSAITEIGAVKTRGGEVIGEFQTLVDPGMPIPPMIVALTGITDAMVAGAPAISQVLPSFLEFLGDAVLVAHNAPFDVGFLKAACREHEYRWPGNDIVDTVTLARRATTSEEAPNKKLGTLARVFGTRVTPNHRALDDAKATSEIMHAMFERLAAWGITHREDLDSLRNPVPTRIRRKAPMADALPPRPGVYIFRGNGGEPLYIGTSKNIRSRVKTYFTTGEQRRAIRDMLEIAESVDGYPTPTELEANVLEIRLIARHRPRYNRRSSRPERTPWVRLTDEPYPRLSVVRAISGEAVHIGPMGGAGDARAAVEALQEVLAIRTCVGRLPKVPKPGARACLLSDMGSCAAPCVHGDDGGYSQVIEALRDAITQDPSPVVEALAERIAEFAGRCEYERAAALRDGVSSLVRGAADAQYYRTLRRCTIVAGRPSGEAWDVVGISRGFLVGTSQLVAPSPEALEAAADALLEGVANPVPDGQPLVEEMQLIAAWLDSPEIRLLRIEGEWSQPLRGAARHASWVEARRDDRALVWDAYVGTSPRV